MMKPARFSKAGIWVERNLYSGEVGYVAWKPHKSRFYLDRSSLLEWLAWPPKTQTGDELREWFNSIESPPPPLN